MKRSARRRGVVAAFLGAGIWACSRPNNVAGIAGTYVMHITVTADTLVLRKDGRYVRSYRAPGEAAVIDSGGWFLSKNGRLVGLRDYPKRWR